MKQLEVEQGYNLRQRSVVHHGLGLNLGSKVGVISSFDPIVLVIGNCYMFNSLLG